jgi:hypothetical protein
MDTTDLEAALSAGGGRADKNPQLKAVLAVRRSGQDPTAGGCPGGAAERTRTRSWRLSCRCGQSGQEPAAGGCPAGAGRADRNPQLEAVLAVRRSGQEPAAGGCPAGAGRADADPQLEAVLPVRAERTRTRSWMLSCRCGQSGQEPAAGGCPGGAAERTGTRSWRLSCRCGQSGQEPAGRVDKNPQLEAVLPVRTERTRATAAPKELSQQNAVLAFFPAVLGLRSVYGRRCPSQNAPET